MKACQSKDAFKPLRLIKQKEMKHKHRWQFARFNDNSIFFLINFLARNEKYAEFICECGKIKVVEVKRCKN